MARPKENEPLERIHLHIYSADLDKLKMLYGDGIGYTKAVRMIIRKYLNGLEERAQKGRSKIKDVEVDVG